MPPLAASDAIFRYVLEEIGTETEPAFFLQD
jgi:hypothetical protein